MRRALYTLILYCLAPLVVVRLLLRSRKAADYRRRIAERFGFFPALPHTGYLWVHAVSVGETVAAGPLVRQLMARHPGVPVLITTMTPTGSAQVKKLFGDQVAHVYVPYDLPGAVTRFLAKSRPCLAVVMETELWPNLFHYCKKSGVPVIVANARLSARSYQGYQRFAALAAQTLNNVEHLAAQGEEDATRFKQLGLDAARLTVTGSIKYDISLSASLKEQGEALRRDLFGQARPVWIAASTHQGEDEHVLEAFAQIKKSLPQSLLVLVPRHPERFNDVAMLCSQRGYQVVRRSDQAPCTEQTDIFVGDTMGELALFLAASDVCYMGGSLVATGGHNILEPAALDVPVVFGPHMFNFAAISTLFLERDAVRQVADSNALADVVTEWLADGSLRDEFACRAKVVLDENRGALERLLALIESMPPFK